MGWIFPGSGHRGIKEGVLFANLPAKIIIKAGKYKMERKYEPTSPLQSVCFLDFIFIPTFDDSVKIFVHLFSNLFIVFVPEFSWQEADE